MKKRKENPRMLNHVLQAVTNLKDANGSTTKKIINQVQTNINQKPRNVVMQIKKALKHAVNTGALKHKAGKYRLTLPSEIKIPKRRAKKGVKQVRRMKKPKKTSRRARHRPRRKLDKARSSISATSTISSGSHSSRSKTGDSVSSSDKEARSTRRRRRSIAKKTVQISRDAIRKRPKRTKMRRPRKQTPMPTADDTQVAENETCQELARQIENLENVFTQNPPIQDPEVFNHDEPLTIEEIPPECCGNPECLCNLKQEPFEDNTGEETIADSNNTNNIDNDVFDDLSDAQNI